MEDAHKRTCDECKAYGDDFYMNEHGELVLACPECWVTKEKMSNDTTKSN